MSEIIRVRCGGCDVKIKAPLKYQGRRVNCPQCGHEVKIPTLDVARSASPAAATSSARPAAVAPVLFPSAEKQPSKPAAAKPVLLEKEQPATLGDDAFLDKKPAAKKPADDEFANLEFDEFDDYGPIEDYGAPAKPRSKARDDVPSPRKKKKRKKSKSSGGGIYIDPSIIGGLALMLIGGGIFVWLWSRGVIWPYAGILCIAGLIGMFKGLLGIDDD